MNSKIDLAVVVDGSVASLDHFHGAEERVAHKGWDMLTVRAGSRSLWCSIWILVAAAVAPSGRWITAIKIVFVGINGADEKNAWEVAPVSLTTKGMDLLRMAA